MYLLGGRQFPGIIKQIMIFYRRLLLCWFCLAAALVKGAETHQLDALKSAVISNYAVLLHAEYEDSLVGARNLQSAIDGFVAAPSPENLEAARAAWINSRNPYLQTEVGRYYDGPIEPIEGFINAWPIDENYLDYTADDSKAGIVNQTDLYPAITRDVPAQGQ